MDVDSALLLVSMALTLLFSNGIIAGWTDMQLMMEREGMFCTGACASPRTAQFDEIQYNIIISVAQVLRTSLLHSLQSFTFCVCACCVTVLSWRRVL